MFRVERPCRPQPALTNTGRFFVRLPPAELACPLALCRRRPLRALVFTLLGGLLVVALTSPAAAQSPTLIVTAPVVISAGGQVSEWSSEPAFAPSVAVTSNIDGTEKVHVLWSTESRTNPLTLDMMWYTSWTAQPWPVQLQEAPQPYLAAVGSTRPRLTVGPQGHLHAAFMTFRRDQGFYDADYIEQLPADTDRPLPQPQTDPNNLLFPTPYEMSDVGLAVSTRSDGREQGHVVWSEFSGSGRPLLYYGRAYRPPSSLAPTSDALAWMGGPGCLDPTQSSPDCYRGNKASLVVLQRPGGTAQDLMTVWEGRDAFAPATRVVYSGSRRLCPPDQPCSWSSPQPVSNNQLSKARGTRQACAAQDSQPSVNAASPSIALSPRSTLHAVWLQQRQAGGPYYVHTARLVYDAATQDYCWDYYETIEAEPSPPLSGGIPPEPPRLAFDRTGRRYAVWNVGQQRVVLATSDLDPTNSTPDHDAYRPWQVYGNLNTGQCGSSGVNGIDVATVGHGGAAGYGGPSIHIVWTATNLNDNQTHICYAQVAALYQTFLPRIDRAGEMGH